MIKTFYKKKREHKVFFKSGLCVRSTAYGDGVREEYLAWRRDFLSRRAKEGEKFTLFAQGSVEGDEGRGGSLLPKLALDGVTFETTEDGKLSLNGRRVQCDIGSELKAWAIGTYPEGSYLFVIGTAGKKTALTCYRLSRGGSTEGVVSTFPLPATLDPKSTLVVFGRHIFFIHNACLGYCYFAPVTCELEETSLGGDKGNAQFEWCQYAKPPIVSDGAGNVFWIKEEDVFGIGIGAPASLLQIVGPKLYTVKALSCKENTLCVTLKSKSGGGQVTEYYETRAGSIEKA